MRNLQIMWGCCTYLFFRVKKRAKLLDLALYIGKIILFF